MNEPPARGTNFAVRDLSNAVVTEIPPLPPLHADDMAPPELVERPHERIFLEIAGLRQNVERKIASD